MIKRYLILVFDYNLKQYDNESYIQEIIELLRTDTYRNKSIQISKQTLLIRVFDENMNSYPYPKDLVDYAITDLIQEEVFSYADIANLNYYCLPTSLKDIEIQTRGFEREIEYLDALVK
jgi:hypothetical protein